jgi:hypothetical protein
MAVKGLLGWRINAGGRLERQRRDAPAHVTASALSWRTLPYRLVHTAGRLKRPAKTLGSGARNQQGLVHTRFGLRPPVSYAVAMHEDFVRILAMVRQGREQQTLLLRNLVDANTGELLEDHLWFTAGNGQRG